MSAETKKLVSIIAMLQQDKKDLAQRLETATLSLKSLESKVEKGDKAKRSSENAAVTQKLTEALEARDALALEVQVSLEQLAVCVTTPHFPCPSTWEEGSASFFFSVGR